MANTSKRNRLDIIDKSTNLYWEKGFYGTSMRNLQEVIDMRPGSIYAAFGSKEGLFKEALQHYTQQGIEQLNKLKLSTGSPLKGLKSFVDATVITSQTDAPSGMCLLAKTISELTKDNAELLAETKRLLLQVEKAFIITLTEAQVAGEIDKEKDTTKLARYLQVQIMGLRIYAGINHDKQTIADMVNSVFLTFEQD
ncbi:MAG: TetR/AcrR family transcriptional regulator [Colwellia sp.]